MCESGQAPQYLIDLVPRYEPQRTLRSADQGLVQTPKTFLKTKGDRAFQAVAASLWNALPQFLKEAASVNIFKNNLKTLLFARAFVDPI